MEGTTFVWELFILRFIMLSSAIFFTENSCQILELNFLAVLFEEKTYNFEHIFA